MNAKKSLIEEECEDLVTDVVTYEAVAKVWQELESAMDHLDEQSHALFSEVLEGIPLAQMAESRGVTADEISLWLGKIKRELLQALREKRSVRQ